MNLNDLKIAIEDIRGNGYYDLEDSDGNRVKLFFQVIGEKVIVNLRTIMLWE